MPETTLRAEVAGAVWKIVAPQGSAVGAEEPVLLLECMKMEIPVPAPHAGTVTALLVAEGDAVEEGQPLARLAP